MAVDIFARAMIAEVITNGGGGGGGGGDGIKSISVNNIPQPVAGGAVNITVPTRVGALTNDKQYQTKTEVQTELSSALTEYVLKADYDALAAKVAALETLLSQTNLSLMMVQDEGGAE